MEVVSDGESKSRNVRKDTHSWSIIYGDEGDETFNDGREAIDFYETQIETNGNVTTIPTQGNGFINIEKPMEFEYNPIDHPDEKRLIFKIKWAYNPLQWLRLQSDNFFAFESSGGYMRPALNFVKLYNSR